jgi:hypothetical protein
MTTEDNNKLVSASYEWFGHQQDAEAVKKQLPAHFWDYEMLPGTRSPDPDSGTTRSASRASAMPANPDSRSRGGAGWRAWELPKW